MKQLGLCTGCETECYRILERYPDGPLIGQPSRVGRMTEDGCQVELLLSDGTEAAITCCRECAKALTPADYQILWEACMDRALVSFTAAGLSPNDRAMQMRQAATKYPIALLRRRRESHEAGRLVIDR